MTEASEFIAAPLWGAIVVGARAWLVPAAVALVVALATLAWGYAQTRGSFRLRLTAATLKALGMALLVVILLDPLWSSSRVRPGENIVVVLADTSGSMQVRGADGSSTAEVFRKQLADERLPWLVRLKQDFDVRRYTFGERLEPAASLETLTFDSRSTNLNAALSALAERFAGRPLAGVVLFSDGTATDAANAGTKLPPIYPVLPPSSAAAVDVTLLNVATTQTGFEDAPVTLTAEAQAVGVGDEPLVCQVLDEAGKVVQSQEQTAGDGEPAAFRLQFRPAKPGLSAYQVRVAAKSQLAVFDKPDATREATLANNRRLVQVDRGRGPYRVLYVGGAPNPEHKFLGRSLAEDPQMELASLIRIARREPKFDFRSRSGESTNPLFRGFDKTDDETERYDQPVFVRLGLKDENELRDGFPKTPEQLFAFHALVLDDVEAELFTTEQMSLISRFVSERGGGLLMLGGPDSFEKGLFAKTPLADVLPVYLQRTVESRPPAVDGYRFQLTREGKLEPWLRLRANEADEFKRLDEMPPFRTLNHVSGIKPGATVLATAVDATGAQQPALVVQTYGRGRAAALMIGDLWRWRLKVAPENQDLEKMWRQLVRRLTTVVAGRVEATAEVVAEEAGGAVRVAVRARDAAYQPLENAQVRLEFKSPDGKTLTVEAEPSRREAGVYETSYVPRADGAYRVAAKVVDGAGAEVGRTEAGWTNNPSADEFRRLTPDVAALEALAKQTGGETVRPERLEAFAAELIGRPAPEMQQQLLPLRYTPWVFALAVACLAGEWGLRRWRGLP